MFYSGLEHSLLFFPFVLGLFLSFRILRIADLSVDGTYVLGASVYGVCVRHGYSPYFAVVVAMVCGGLVGGGVGILLRYVKANPLLIGILVSFILHSVNLQILGQPNLSLVGLPTTLLFASSMLLSLAMVGLCLGLLLLLILHSKFGLRLRAVGENESLASEFGIPAMRLKCTGLGISSSFVALSGALTSQSYGFVDGYMGVGMALIAITILLLSGKLGAILDARERFVGALFCAFAGCFGYFLCIHGLQYMRINPVNMNLAVGSLMLLVLALPQGQSSSQLGASGC